MRQPYTYSMHGSVNIRMLGGAGTVRMCICRTTYVPNGLSGTMPYFHFGLAGS